MTVGLMYGAVLLLCTVFLLLDIILSKSTGQRWLIAIIIPTTIGILLLTHFAVESVRGQPLTKIPDKFTLVGKLEAKPKIFMWIVREGDTYPTTIVIPWSEDMAKRAAEADRKSRMGIGQVRDKGRENGLFSPGEFIFHKLEHGEDQPK